MVLRKSLVATLALTVLLCVAATASASFNIDLEVAEQTDPIPPGESAELTVTVLAEAASDWVCPTGGSFDIGLAVEDEDAEIGFEGDISPSVSFDVDADVYGGANERWSGEGTATFTPKINNNVERGHLTHSYTLRATFDGSGPSGCEEVPPSEAWSEADGSTSVSIEAEAPEEEEEDDDEDDGDGGTQGDTEEGPAPIAGLLVLTAIVTAALRRRR